MGTSPKTPFLTNFEILIKLIPIWNLIREGFGSWISVLTADVPGEIARVQSPKPRRNNNRRKKKKQTHWSTSGNDTFAHCFFLFVFFYFLFWVISCFFFFLNKKQLKWVWFAWQGLLKKNIFLFLFIWNMKTLWKPCISWM